MASIVVPTRDRPDYLDVTLRSVLPQAVRAGAEVLVVGDGPDQRAAELARLHGARYLELPARSGANAARNAGVNATGADLVVFIDDDVEAPPGWLQALLAGVNATPEAGVFGGPIRARLEGGGPHACGREKPPITTLDYGARDRDVQLVWSANMAVRRAALGEVGPFDERLKIRGDEEDWQHRYAALGHRTRYLAGAGLDHRRTAADARLSALARTAYGQGRAARRYDLHKHSAPSTAAELRTLIGCAWHVVRRRCAIGVVLGAHSAGRLHESLVRSRP